MKTCCGYLLEAPLWGASNEYPKHVFVEKYEKCLLDTTPLIWSTHNTQSFQCLCALTLKLPIKTIVVCFVVCLWFKSHFCKQCGPRSDFSSSSLIRVHTVCLYAKIGLKSLQEIFSRRHKQTTFSDAGFLGILRVNLAKQNLQRRALSEKPSEHSLWAITIFELGFLKPG